jgi:hypothetical protein
VPEETGTMIEIANMVVVVVVFMKHLNLRQLQIVGKKVSKRLKTVFEEMVVKVKERIKKVDEMSITMKSLMKKICMKTTTQVAIM